MFKYNFKEYSQEYVQESLFRADALILKEVDPNTKILEVGCASGHMSKYMQEKLNCKVTGVEYSTEAGENANKYQEKTYIGDLDNSDFLTTISGKFDIIIFPAVLEHLKSPEKVLNTLLNLLNKNGKVIISLPNIAHYSIRINLLFGKFDYTDFGIMDSTHLKFFTYKTIHKLLKKSGLKTEKFFASFPFPGADLLQRIPFFNRIIYLFINKLVFRIMGEELIFICKKK